VEPLANVMRTAQEFHPEIIRAAPQSMLRFTHDIGSGSSTTLQNSFIVVRVSRGNSEPSYVILSEAKNLLC
jgi:hypothetical protein